MTVTVSVVVPTHNREELLLEAVASVFSQSYSDWELIIVDDGSIPPVDASALESPGRQNIRVIRNEVPANVYEARRQGVRAAQGELVIHLDDDDLLEETALASATKVFRDHPELDVLFLGVQGFGSNARGFEMRQSHAMQGVLAESGGVDAGSGLVMFNSMLFKALLAGVPMAFQRIMVRRQAWDRVSDFREAVYSSSCEKPGARPVNHISPLWNESEWALYAAALCETALFTQALYLQRCDGQGYFSTIDDELETIDAHIRIMKYLSAACRDCVELRAWYPTVNAYTAKAYFNRAYFFATRGKRRPAFKSLFTAFRTQPRLLHAKLLFRIIFLPG